MSTAPQTADDPEIHIAGVLVQARPEAVGALRTAITALADTELVGAGDDGRIAVVVEGVGAASVLQVLDALRELPGVLNVALVYQHAEPRSALQQGVTP
ncbi:chaperone NapD [Rubrivivax gelatinosus]|uniref:Chaperone NapD n=1 Tax=Rubrivivax gelatinosus TaxID=28068 RepID=A0A4V2SGD9_RUBGE|nr:chaperone NapD [Rubrivivax gelatinosus]MBK1686609.1 hypothetical protein [Rubrivivax gelatinosus]TCP00858.1 periplasmic nitrate reductase chaperone NapD [Rubrivivax gelatinosus]